MWRPRNQKSRIIIKLALWSGLLVWMIFFFAYGVVLAPRLADPNIYSGLGSRLFAEALSWVAPIWVVFTTLLVVVVMARFVAKKIGGPSK
jgi:uncharacterized protein (DUF983 family)